MSKQYIPVAFGCKTMAFLSECATCGKPYIVMGEDGWRTVYAYDEKTRTGMWLLYCADCYAELPKKVDE